MLLKKGLNQIRRARSYGNFLAALPGFLRRRMTLHEATTIFRQRMANRGENLLEMFKGAIYDNPGSPYLPLLKLAGCDYADIERGVREQGVEPTLAALRDAGVYITYEEFTGRVPLVRGGREIPRRFNAFANPYLTSTYQMSTGGSSGPARRVDIDIEHLWARVPEQILSDTIQGYTGIPVALWFDGIPGNAVNSLLTRVAFDNVAERWFTPSAGRDARPTWDYSIFRNRMAEWGILRTARWVGAKLPRPESVRLEEAEIVAEWALEALARHGRCGVKTMLSRALRVALAAEERGFDLTGLTISGGGEPPTPAKARAITRTGARLISNYHFQEAGAIGKMCMNAAEVGDQHLMQDHLALIPRRREVPGFDLEIDAFCFTTLLPSARTLMLNVETDDYGVIEQRDCGCPWQQLGLHTHLREVRSFRKMTGEGLTLIGTELVHILEEVLPRHFGGGPLDYQLLEEEDERGFTRVSVIVSPKVGKVSDEAIVNGVLDALEAGNRALWEQAGSLRVLRREPIWTGRGKLMPLHLMRNGEPESAPTAAQQSAREQ